MSITPSNQDNAYLFHLHAAHSFTDYTFNTQNCVVSETILNKLNGQTKNKRMMNVLRI